MGKEMTESVRDVLAEMRAALSEDTRCNRNTCECCLGHSILMGKFDVYIPRIEAALAREQSPERKAFVRCECGNPSGHPEKQAAMEAFVVALAWQEEHGSCTEGEERLERTSRALLAIIEREKQPLPSRSQAGPTRAEGGLASVTAVQDLLDDLANGHREYWSAMRYLSERGLLEREKQPREAAPGEELSERDIVRLGNIENRATGEPVRRLPPKPKRETAEGLLEAAPIAERLRALADSMNEPLFGADTNSQTFGIRMVVLPALKSMQSELLAIAEECERLAGEMRVRRNTQYTSPVALGLGKKVASDKSGMAFPSDLDAWADALASVKK